MERRRSGIRGSRNKAVRVGVAGVGDRSGDSVIAGESLQRQDAIYGAGTQMIRGARSGRDRGPVALVR